jgi:hypothetical protein
VGTATIPELDADEREDLYVSQAAVLPSCLVPDLLQLSRNPMANWRLLWVWASKLGSWSTALAYGACFAPWLLPCTSRSPA